MRYLITFSNNQHPPFFTEWYDKKNHYTRGMVIYDIVNQSYSVDGETFTKIEIDHL